MTTPKEMVANEMARDKEIGLRITALQHANGLYAGSDQTAETVLATAKSFYSFLRGIEE